MLQQNQYRYLDCNRFTIFKKAAAIGGLGLLFGGCAFGIKALENILKNHHYNGTWTEGDYIDIGSGTGLFEGVLALYAVAEAFFNQCTVRPTEPFDYRELVKVIVPIAAFFGFLVLIKGFSDFHHEKDHFNISSREWMDVVALTLLALFILGGNQLAVNIKKVLNKPNEIIAHYEEEVSYVPGYGATGIN